MEFIMIWRYISFSLHLLTPPGVLVAILAWAFYHARISVVSLLLFHMARIQKEDKMPTKPLLHYCP